MIINIETKYSVGDKVFIIAEVSKYNDLYRNETKWVVAEDTDQIAWNPPKVALEISKIVIHQYMRRYDIVYKIQDYVYTEKDMFDTLEDAQIECDKRNNDMNKYKKFEI